MLDGLHILSNITKHDQTRSNSTKQGVQTVKCLVTKQYLMVIGRQTFPVCPGPKIKMSSSNHSKQLSQNRQREKELNSKYQDMLTCRPISRKIGTQSRYVDLCNMLQFQFQRPFFLSSKKFFLSLWLLSQPDPL